jgi:hypothetical protein
MSKYFYRKRFLFGNVKYSKANDPTGKYVYDIVYIEIIDSLENNKGESLTGAFTTKNYDGTNLTVYPNSIANMKEALEGIKISGTSINTDEYLMPRYMRTIQAETGSPLGFILAVPLCYALPGNGDTIIKRIAASGFNFNSIDFDVDRLVIESSLSNSDTKYLLFPRKDITGINPGDALSYIVLPENKLPLFTEDGLPLQLEL